jgi:hypothetical protein
MFVIARVHGGSGFSAPGHPAGPMLAAGSHVQFESDRGSGPLSSDILVVSSFGKRI